MRARGPMGAVGALGTSGAVLVMAAALSMAGGCGDEFDDDYNLVKDLRLLAVRAEPPEVAAGDEVTLVALALDPRGKGGTEAIGIRWIACALPPIPGRGSVNPECMTEDLTAPYLFPVGTGPTLRLRVPPIPDEVLGLPDVTGGRYLPVRLRLETPAGQLDGMYRLRVTAETTAGAARNHNPVLTEVLHGGTPLVEDKPLEVAPDAQLGLRARFGEASAEKYTVDLTALGGDKREATETLNVSWFATAGHFSPGSTGGDVDTVLRLDRNRPAAGATVDVWAVGRDERGGTAWLHRTIRVK